MMRAAIYGLAALFLTASASQAEDVTSARYIEPTSRYGHGVLGDAIEYGALEMEVRNGRVIVQLPVNHVFEDIAPRLADVDNDGDREVIVVETDIGRGAALAIYDETGKITETPHIGRAHRWLAPLGAADLDGDGAVELAYIDRPHLAKTLRVWRFEDGKLSEVAAAPGLTNHKIGWDFIAGGIRDCGAGPEIITASADWSRIMATQFDGSTLTSRDIGTYDGPESLDTALTCP